MKWLETILLMAINVSQPLLVQLGQQYIDASGDNAKADIASAYPQIDTRAEALAAKTPTPIDDEVVKKVKAAMEEVAAANGFTLSNVDAD